MNKPKTDQKEIEKREAEFFDNVYRTEAIDTANLQAVGLGDARNDWTEFALRMLGDVNGKKILDVGSGLGEHAVRLALAGANVWSFDVSTESVRATLALADKMGCGERIQAQVAADVDIPRLYEPAFFDGVFGSLILHHLVDLQLAGKSISSVMKPGASAVFCENSDRNPITRWARRALHGRMGFRRVGTDDEHRLSTSDVSNFGLSFGSYNVYYTFRFFRDLHRVGPFKLKWQKRAFNALDYIVDSRLPFLSRYGNGMILKFVK